MSDKQDFLTVEEEVAAYYIFPAGMGETVFHSDVLMAGQDAFQ